MQHASPRAIEKIKPLNDQVLIRRHEPDETQDGIYLAEGDRAIPRTCDVLAVGPGRVLDNGRREPMRVKAGDIALVPIYRGVDVVVDGEELLMVSIDEIVGVLEAE